MKLIYLVILILPLLLMGCYSTYTIKDFPSKDEFYKDINNCAKDRTIKVTLKNDSSIISKDGIEIKNDTLYLLSKKTRSSHKKVVPSSLKDIKYQDANYKTAIIILKEGKSFKADSIKSTPDSIVFVGIDTLTSKKYFTTVNQVQKINYRVGWKEIPSGSLLGIVGGTFINLIGIIPVKESHPDITVAGGQRWETDYLAQMIYGAAAGFIIGSITGYIIGYNYTYEFP